MTKRFVIACAASLLLAGCGDDATGGEVDAVAEKIESDTQQIVDEREAEAEARMPRPEATNE